MSKKYPNVMHCYTAEWTYASAQCFLSARILPINQTITFLLFVLHIRFQTSHSEFKSDVQYERGTGIIQGKLIGDDIPRGGARCCVAWCRYNFEGPRWGKECKVRPENKCWFSKDLGREGSEIEYLCLHEKSASVFFFFSIILRWNKGKNYSYFDCSYFNHYSFYSIYVASLGAPPMTALSIFSWPRGLAFPVCF